MNKKGNDVVLTSLPKRKGGKNEKVFSLYITYRHIWGKTLISRVGEN